MTLMSTSDCAKGGSNDLPYEPLLTRLDELWITAGSELESECRLCGDASLPQIQCLHLARQSHVRLFPALSTPPTLSLFVGPLG